MKSQVIKINNKMGNIEIKQRPKRPVSIFGKRQRNSRSPFREAISQNSPHYQEFSPIKYSQTQQNRKKQLKEFIPVESHNKSPVNMHKQMYFHSKSNNLKRESNRQDSQVGQKNYQNRQKCDQIIRKVRNFNDFLVELKRRLKEDCHQKDDNQCKKRGQVSMSVKLQNQRVQLQKYKKLMERQLSKTHSIESISISNNQAGQKILTIQYQNLNTQEKLKHEQPTSAKTQEQQYQQYQQYQQQPQQPIDQNYTPPKHNQKKTGYKLQEEEINEQSESSASNNIVERLAEVQKNQFKITHQEKLREAKVLWELLNRKTNNLGQLLAKQQIQNSQGQGLRDYLKAKERTVRINNLLMNLQEANRQSMEVQRKIKLLLHLQ